MNRLSLAPNPQRIGDAVDVIEPGGNQRNLQNALIVKADATQAGVVIGTDFGRILRDLDDVIQHHAILLVYGSGFVILAQGFN